MEVKKARKIIKINKLINKKKSREIIEYIKNKKNILSFKLTEDELDKIEKIRKEYNNLNKKTKSNSPRNLPFYKIIKKRYNNFSWSKINKHYDIKYNAKYLNQRVTLASLLLERVKKEKEPKLIEKKKEIN